MKVVTANAAKAPTRRRTPGRRICQGTPGDLISPRTLAMSLGLWAIIPVMTPKASLQPQEMTAFLDDFRQTIEHASSRLLEIPEDQSERPRAEGKWSSKQVIGHLIDSAANNHQRFVRAQFTDDLVFSGYEQEDWIRVQNYQQESWRELVQLWKSYNQHIVHLMSFVPEETRTKLRSKHNLHEIASDTIREDEPVTLDFFMRDYVDHMKKHLEQILG